MEKSAISQMLMNFDETFTVLFVSYQLNDFKFFIHHSMKPCEDGAYRYLTIYRRQLSIKSLDHFVPVVYVYEIR